MAKKYRQYLEERYGLSGDGIINEFISRKDGKLMFAGVDLGELVQRHGAPLEINYCPLITKQIDQMQEYASEARSAVDYAGAFLYAYATKANFSEEVVRTALQAGVHYETSATADVLIATELWRQGLLSSSCYIYCNGSKEPEYLDAILRLRAAGNKKVVPVIDDLEEWKNYRLRSAPLQFGVRAREFARCAGGDRFGLLRQEIDQLVNDLPDSTHDLILYHAMVGSQIEAIDEWLERLEGAIESYCQLRLRVPTIRQFSFGGGMPTSAYDLGFSFDYKTFLTRLFATISATCARYNVPVPDVVGEFGRYTVANHSVYLLEVGQIKQGRAGAEPWYLLNGSLMVSLPDTLIVPDQRFIMLPLEGWDDEIQGVRLGGRRTCDSDDMYPRPDQEPLILPQTTGGLVVAIFGVGAYQQMISGRGGAHHCLNPEMKRLIIEQQGAELITHEVAAQDLTAITSALGYNPSFSTPLAYPSRSRRISTSRMRRRQHGWLQMVNNNREVDSAELNSKSVRLIG